MTELLERAAPTRLTLNARTAADLMTPDPVSLREDASVREAVALFVDRGVSAAPVIDEAGRPVGVVSHSDIVTHDRERVEYLPGEGSRPTPREGFLMKHGFQVENVDRTRVRDVMTPALFSVRPDTPAAGVIEQMLALHVHRLFVVDKAGVLVGVITTFDVLGKLRP